MNDTVLSLVYTSIWNICERHSYGCDTDAMMATSASLASRSPSASTSAASNSVASAFVQPPVRPPTSPPPNLPLQLQVDVGGHFYLARVD